MGFVPADLAAIPVHQLVHRRLRLGPFSSGRDLVMFLFVATVGAVVASLTSAAVWLPFLAIGATVAFVRVEGRSLDDFVLGYCRYHLRSSTGAGRSARAPSPGPRTGTPGRGSTTTIRTGGIPIAYLPPQELQHLFEEWRSALNSVDYPLGCRMRGERFSAVPFLPEVRGLHGPERIASESYRELVRALLRHRFRRVVDLSTWTDPSERPAASVESSARLDGLMAGLERLGVPIRNAPPGSAGTAFEAGVST